MVPEIYHCSHVVYLKLGGIAEGPLGLEQSVKNIFEYSNIQIYGHKNLFGHSFVSIFQYEYIRILVSVKKNMNIFGHSFVSVLECEK